MTDKEAQKQVPELSAKHEHSEQGTSVHVEDDQDAKRAETCERDNQRFERALQPFPTSNQPHHSQDARCTKGGGYRAHACKLKHIENRL